MLLKMFKRLLSGRKKSYTTRLDAYIIANDPKNIADVERLAQRYDLAVRKGFFV